MLSGGNRVIALIPARGGSKGFPRKNIALLAGKPLIVYTIEAAQDSLLVDEIWVSSDDKEILSIAAACGVRTLMRPLELAYDYSSAAGVVEHFISELRPEVCKADPLIIYLQPTSPLRNATHIDSALLALSAVGASSTLSVVEAEKSPFKSFQIDGEGRLRSLFDERLSNECRQALPRCYFPNGAIYAFTLTSFELRRGFPSNGSLPFIMSAEHSIDIDNADDFARAQTMLGV